MSFERCVLAFAALAAGCAPGQASGDPAAAGAALYAAHGCAVCHGPSGAGDGPAAAGLGRPPADFGTGPARFGRTRGAVARALGDRTARPADSVMPVYAHIPRHERELIADFILSLKEKR